jgi:hypothetical protein
VLFFIHFASCRAHVAGMTSGPDLHRMVEIARNVVMVDWGFLIPGQFLIHDRDGKFCPTCQQAIDATRVTRIASLARSQNLHAYAE